MESVNVRLGHDQVLEDITLQVEQRQIFLIVGPNGGGKTTLLKTIMGVLAPNTGTVAVFDQSPQTVRRRGFFGYLPQKGQYAQDFPALVRDVVAMTRFAQKKWLEVLTGKDKRLIEQALLDVDMAEFSRHPFATLSGCQKQRVLIARALAKEPRILILDEPSTGLDTVAQDSFYQLLLKLRDEQNLTIIMVSHDIGAVSTIGDQIACLKRKIHFHGPPQACMTPENLRKTFGRNIHFLMHDQNCQTCKRRK